MESRDTTLFVGVGRLRGALVSTRSTNCQQQRQFLSVAREMSGGITSLVLHRTRGGLAEESVQSPTNMLSGLVTLLPDFRRWGGRRLSEFGCFDCDVRPD